MAHEKKLVVASLLAIIAGLASSRKKSRTPEVVPVGVEGFIRPDLKREMDEARSRELVVR